MNLPRILRRARRRQRVQIDGTRSQSRRTRRILALYAAREQRPTHPTLVALQAQAGMYAPHRGQHGSGLRSGKRPSPAKRRRLRAHHARLRNVALRSAAMQERQA